MGKQCEGRINHAVMNRNTSIKQVTFIDIFLFPSSPLAFRILTM